MRFTSIVIAVFLYLGLWLLTYGFSLAYFQRKYTLIAKDYYWLDVMFCLVASAFPMSLLTYFLAMGLEGFKYGWRIK